LALPSNFSSSKPEKRTWVKKEDLIGSRREIREKATEKALEFLMRH
jgi:hypothetical protein